jgi:hypothetical protein
MHAILRFTDIQLKQKHYFSFVKMVTDYKKEK